MKINKTIQVFEYKQLKIDQHGFERQHWEALGWYNEQNGGGFFSLSPNSVKFNQYVGVIQVGNLTIEILPKISQTDERGDKSKWQKVLIDMLRECRWMKIFAHDKASLRFKSNSILEAYLELFIHECEELVREGLVKKYRTRDNNCSTLKGKLLFNKQLQLNLIHKERFYTRHQVFDKENLYNQILLKALKLIPRISQSPLLKDKVYNLILSFPELNDITITPSTFDNIIFDRRTTRYKEAIEIAAMLLLNYRPDISSGQNHVLAILFDMNDLWEEFFYRQLYKNKPVNWLISPQNSRKFWKLDNLNMKKTIRPDIVIHNKSTGENIILDTKWKIPDRNIPADEDLKQMYVYNEYWTSKNAILVYPNANYTEAPVYIGGSFAETIKNSEPHSCGVMRVSVLDKRNKNLDFAMGSRINEFLQKTIFS